MTRKRRKSQRAEPVKRSPLFQEDTMLSFDDPADQEILATLTVPQKMDKFMSKYMALVDPFVTYATYFEHSHKTAAHILLDIKRNYNTMVLKQEWTERKYVEIIDALLMAGSDVNEYTLQSHGILYDRGALAPEKKPQQQQRRRRVRRPGR